MASIKMTIFLMVFLGISLTVINSEKDGKFSHNRKFENFERTGVLDTLERIEDEEVLSPLFLAHTKSDLPQIRSYGVKCYGSEMIVSIEFMEVFNGVIYAEGYRDKEECVFLKWQSGLKIHTFSLKANKCGSRVMSNVDGTAKQLRSHLVIRSKKTSSYIRNPHDIVYLNLQCSVKDCEAGHTPPPPPAPTTLVPTSTIQTPTFDKPQGPPMTYNPCGKNNKSRLCDIIF